MALKRSDGVKKKKKKVKSYQFEFAEESAELEIEENLSVAKLLPTRE